MGNCLCKNSALREASEALILVVGNDAECKSRVAQDLAEARGATERHLNKAGVRFFARKVSPEEPVVIDTTPLKTFPELSRVETSRVWISQNSLRQRSGQIVYVVCVIGPTDADEISREPKFMNNDFSWLHVLAHVFDKNRKDIIILVKSEESTDVAFQQRLSQDLKRDGFRWKENILFVKSKRTYLNSPIMKTVLQSSVDTGNAGDKRTIESGIEATSPFRLPMVAQNGADQFGPWGPENVILFGISGSGRSTLAQMLTTGRLNGVDSLSTKFSTSSGLRGETKKVNVGQGRGWRVVDTPGLGEPNDDAKSGVSTDRAGKLIKDYVMLVQGVYSHFIFVFKKDRVSKTDTALWGFFKKMFHGVGVRNHRIIVVSGADKKWVDENSSHLKNCFEGCDIILPADFPSMEPDVDSDEEAEKEVQTDLEDIRLQSLKALEEELASLCRWDVSCRLGMWSLGTQRSLIARGEDESLSFGIPMQQTAASGWVAVKPQPSDYETARTIIRIKSFMTSTFLPGQKLELSLWEGNKEKKTVVLIRMNSSTTPTVLPGQKLNLSPCKSNKEINGTAAEKCMTRDGTPRSKLLMGLIRLIKDTDEAGCFVSSEWLLSLQENERESLLSVLRGAGYAEACQTSTTTLFARIKNDVEGRTSTEESGSFSTGKRVDNLPGEMRGLSMDKNAEISNEEIADVSGPDNPGESSSPVDDGRRRQVATWQSFQAAIKSKRDQRFCVSTQWFNNLTEPEKEALVQSLREAKYKQISQTSNTTWYARFRGKVGNLPGPASDDDASRSGPADDDASSSSNNKNGNSGNVEKSGIRNFFGWLRPKRNANDEDNERGSSDAENRVETSQIQNGESCVCHPQLLTVNCSSSSEAATVLSSDGDLNEDFITYRFGESIVTIPGMGPSQNISTSMEKLFSITKIEFTGARSREGSMHMKAIATTSLSCCVQMDPHLQKVRLKFSRISGEARNVEPEEEWCNAIVVSSVYTTVSCFMKRRADRGYREQIDLLLDDEVSSSGGRTVSEGDLSTGDLVWMENSARTPDRCDPGTTTLVLQREIDRRRLEDSQRSPQGAYPLLSQKPPPVMFEGKVDLAHHCHPDSFLQFRIWYQLQVSYYKPSRAVLEEGPVWFAINTTKLIDFGSYLTITTKSINATSVNPITVGDELILLPN